MKILIVDDSKFSQKLLSNLLKELDEDLEIILANDGREGLEKFKNIRPDCSIIDLLMPTIDGRELVKLIKKYDNNAKIFVLTADVQKNVKREMEQCGIISFINKPLDREKVKSIYLTIKEESYVEDNFEHDDNLAYDILKEFFNIAVGKAADLLSQMLNKRILLSIPSVKIIKTSSQVNIKDYFQNSFDGTLMVSSISFQKDIKGLANLIFPAKKMRTIINLSLGENLHYNSSLDFTELDFDVTKEIGNVILNSIMGEMGNLLGKDLEYTLPDVQVFNLEEFLKRIRESKYVNSLILNISFTIKDINVAGAIIVNLSIDSFKDIMKILKGMEEDLYE